MKRQQWQWELDAREAGRDLLRRCAALQTHTHASTRKCARMYTGKHTRTHTHANPHTRQCTHTMRAHACASACGARVLLCVMWCLITPAVCPASAWCASRRATPHTSSLGVGHQIVAGVWAAAALLWGVLGARACARSRCTSLHQLLLTLPCGAAASAGACVAWLVRERRALRQRAHASAQGSRRCTGGS